MTAMAPPPAALPPPEALRALIGEGLPGEAAAGLLPGAAVARLVVERVHFPGARPVQMQFRAVGGDGAGAVLIGEWLGEGAAEAAGAEAARLAKPRRGQAGAAGTPALRALPAEGLVLRRPGFDTRLPGLRLLHDPPWARERLASLGLDPSARVSLVAHRLGKRAVLRIDGPQGPRFARLRPVTSPAGQEAYGRHLALWQALEGRTGLAIPRPLGFDADLGLALFDALPGRPPVFQGLDGFRATQAVMRALGRLQALPLRPPPHLPADEMATLLSWQARLRPVFPGLAARLAGPLARLAAEMAAPAGDLPPVPCHRDLHEGQILLDGAAAGLLDFDTLRLGDPALDTGNLQAHLVLASLRDGRPRQAFLSAMETALPRLPLCRIALWRRAALLRLAMIYAFGAEPPAVIAGLVEAAG